MLLTRATLAGMVLASACSSNLDRFNCQQSTMCVLDGRAGVCESNGFCSFPDATCPSGRRYASASGQLDGDCVEASGLADASSSDSAPPRDGPPVDGGGQSFTQPYSCDQWTVGLYHFDSGDGTDSCGQANPLTSAASMNTAAGPADPFGQALLLSAADVWRTLPVPGTELQLGETFTVEAFVRPASLPEVSYYGYIAAINDGVNGRQFYLAIDSTGEVIVATALGDCATLNPDLGTATGITVDEDLWNHIRFSFSTEEFTYRVWKNGLLSFTASPPMTTSFCQAPDAGFTVGNAGNGTQPFYGGIDEVRLSTIIRYD